jgi:tetrahydromethanopterin S-methyltransferase subunit G
MPAENQPREDADRIVKRLEVIELKIDLFNKAILGDLEGYRGLLTRVSALEQNHQMMGDRIDDNHRRIDVNTDYRKALTNRAIGVAIGLSLGSAGVGATIATIITKMLGG